MWKICNSGATFRATLLEISRNILKYKGNKSPILKENNEWEVVKSLKNASHVAQGKNISSVVVNKSKEAPEIRKNFDFFILSKIVKMKSEY